MKQTFTSYQLSKCYRLIRKYSRLAGLIDARQLSHLKRQLRKAVRRLDPSKLSPQLKGALAAALMATGANQLLAQPFAAPVVDPFGLVVDITDPDAILLPIFVDIDADGDLDVFSLSYDNVISFFKNVGTPEAPNYAAPVENPFGISPINTDDFTFPHFADFDGDGDSDLLLSAYTETYGQLGYVDLQYQENTGSPTQPAFSARVSLSGRFNVPINPSAITFVDLDGDADLDILGTRYDTLGLEGAIYYENLGSSSPPAYGAAQVNPFDILNPVYYEDFAAIDADQDGDFDLLSAVYTYNNGNFSGSMFRYRENVGTATSPSFTAPVDNAFGLPVKGQDFYTLRIEVADIDNDGDLDLFELAYEEMPSGYDRYVVNFYENLRTPVSTKEPVIRVAASPNPATTSLSLVLEEVPSTVEVWDITGRPVAAFSDTAILDVSPLPAGIYQVIATLASGERIHASFSKVD